MNQDTKRAKQAGEIVKALEIHEDDMNEAEYDFFYGTAMRVKRYGLSIKISERQLDWLKDLHTKYIGYKYEE